MAIKLGNIGKYSNGSGNYSPASMRFSDGLLDNRYRGDNNQTQFINNMQKDPGLTLATSIGGLLGSIVGNTVNENGIRKGTESAMNMLDNLNNNSVQGKPVNGGSVSVGDATVSMPAPGIGFMGEYMSKYNNDDNPVQLNNDITRGTDFIRQSGNNLYANATPDEIRNMIRRQAMAEGRSSQQIDRIMANVDPEITAGYNKYMDEKDAANYAAALGYIEQDRFNDAMALVPNINNPNLVKALGVANDYAMQKKNLQLKRDALMMKATGNRSGSGTTVIPQTVRNPFIPAGMSDDSVFIGTLPQGYTWELLSGKPANQGTTDFYKYNGAEVELADGTKTTGGKVAAVSNDIRTNRALWFDPNDEASLDNNAKEIAANISKIVANGQNVKQYLGSPEVAKLIEHPALYNRVKEKLVNNQIMQPEDNSIQGMLDRISQGESDYKYSNNLDNGIISQSGSNRNDGAYKPAVRFNFKEKATPSTTAFAVVTDKDKLQQLGINGGMAIVYDKNLLQKLR